MFPAKEYIIKPDSMGKVIVMLIILFHSNSRLRAFSFSLDYNIGRWEEKEKWKQEKFYMISE